MRSCRKKKVVSVVLLALAWIIEFENKPAGILLVNRVVMILPTGFGPIADVWRDILDFVDFIHFKKWIVLALGSRCK